MLPVEILHEVTLLLDTADIFRCLTVCKDFHSASQQNLYVHINIPLCFKVPTDDDDHYNPRIFKLQCALSRKPELHSRVQSYSDRHCLSSRVLWSEQRRSSSDLQYHRQLRHHVSVKAFSDGFKAYLHQQSETIAREVTLLPGLLEKWTNLQVLETQLFDEWTLEIMEISLLLHPSLRHLGFLYNKDLQAPLYVSKRPDCAHRILSSFSLTSVRFEGGGELFDRLLEALIDLDERQTCLQNNPQLLEIQFIGTRDSGYLVDGAIWQNIAFLSPRLTSLTVVHPYSPDWTLDEIAHNVATLAPSLQHAHLIKAVDHDPDQENCIFALLPNLTSAVLDTNILHDKDLQAVPSGFRLTIRDVEKCISVGWLALAVRQWENVKCRLDSDRINSADLEALQSIAGSNTITRC